MEKISQPNELPRPSGITRHQVRALGRCLAAVDLVLLLAGCGNRTGNIDCYQLSADYKVPMSDANPTYNFTRKWRKCVDDGAPAPVCDRDNWDVLHGSTTLVPETCTAEKEGE